MKKKTRKPANALPPAVVDKVEKQRHRLRCANELLACVALAYDVGRDFDLCAAMQAVREMIDDAVTALDQVELSHTAARHPEDG